jgi:hypothetical protein
VDSRVNRLEPLLGSDNSREINDIHLRASRASTPISAAQQQVWQMGSVYFHMVEAVFNMMIICNIYHSAVRKIHL